MRWLLGYKGCNLTGSAAGHVPNAYAPPSVGKEETLVQRIYSLDLEICQQKLQKELSSTMKAQKLWHPRFSLFPSS